MDNIFKLIFVDQKLENEITDKLIQSKLIYKDQQLKMVIRKYCDLINPHESLSDDKVQ